MHISLLQDAICRSDIFFLQPPKSSNSLSAHQVLSPHTHFSWLCIVTIAPVAMSMYVLQHRWLRTCDAQIYYRGTHPLPPHMMIWLSEHDDIRATSRTNAIQATARVNWCHVVWSLALWLATTMGTMAWGSPQDPKLVSSCNESVVARDDYMDDGLVIAAGSQTEIVL
jgi:hypothetical protein